MMRSAATEVEVLESEVSPQPKVVGINRPLPGGIEWQWSEVTGTVTFVGEEAVNLLVELSDKNGAVLLSVRGASSAELLPLLNCRLQARGFAGSRLDEHGQAVLGELVVPRSEPLKVEAIPEALWQETRVVELHTLAGTNLPIPAGTLVQVRGRILRQAPEDSLIIGDEQASVAVRLQQTRHMITGTEVRAIGRLQREQQTLVLRHAFCQHVVAEQPVKSDETLSLLTSALQVHSLSTEEASRKYPVKLKGVITSSGNVRVQDATRGSFIEKNGFDFAPAFGEFYEIEGVTTPGKFAPNVVPSRATFLGLGQLPKPIHTTYEQLMTLSECTMWAELEGVVQSVLPTGPSSGIGQNWGKCALSLATRGGYVLVAIAEPVTTNWANSVVDAEVRVRGVIGAQFNDKRQVRGAYLSTPSSAWVCIVKPGVADPASLPRQSLATLMRFDPQGNELHRVKVAGQITHRQKETYFLTDGVNGLAFYPKNRIEAAVGDLVEVTGFQDLSEPTPVLREAAVSKQGRAPLPQPGLRTISDLFTGELNSAPIRLRASLLSVRTNGTERVFELQAGPRSFTARQDLQTTAPARILAGSLVEVMGVCAGRVTKGLVGLQMDSFDLLLNSPADVRVLKAPPGWTSRDALMVIGFLAVAVLLAMLWISLLRRRVDERTGELRAEIETRKQTETKLEEKTRLLEAEIEERKRIEQDAEEAHQEVVRASRLAGMAEVATGVLHNVGNVLNSVNVSAELVAQRVRKSRLQGLTKLADLVDQRADQLGRFLTEDPAGRQVPFYLRQLDHYFRDEQKAQEDELRTLRESVEHIKEIVAMQQTYARSATLVEKLPPSEVIEDALRIHAGAFSRHNVEVRKEFEEVPPFVVDKHKLLQILVNLFSNAKYACEECKGTGKRVVVRLRLGGAGRVVIEVQDNGVGIAPQNLGRIFIQGFTTRRDGHGFGLHSSALAARQMGGTLVARSEGPGKGATFTLELPLEPPKVDGQNSGFKS
jgi:signal transduction histidine kinase